MVAGDQTEEKRPAPLGAVIDAVDRLIPPALRHDREEKMRARVLVASSIGIGLLVTVSQTIRAFTLPITATFFSGVAVIIFFYALPWFQWVTRSSRLAGGVLSLALVLALPAIHYQVHHFPAPVLVFFPAVPVVATFFVGIRLGLVAVLALAGAVVGLVRALPWGLSPEYADYTPTLAASAAVCTAICYLLAVVYERNHRRNEADLKRINQELAAARARAEEADRRKTEFLRHMSHELRTPLNAIVGYSELLTEELEEGDPEPRADAEKIGAASRHLLGLINDLLDISKIEAGAIALHFEEFAPTELFTDLEGTLAPLASGNGNRLTLDVDAALGVIRSDRQRLHQILLNLAGNACKFTRDGAITVRCRRDGDAQVTFEVADTGVGIDPARQSEIFEPFVQVDASVERRRQGTGLGLAITRKLVEHLGGTISVRSALGQGSTFTFALPRAGPSTG
ncbi:MAG: HAMP domain-containing sensor histidine kinase [Nannocystaceae bacterium]